MSKFKCTNDIDTTGKTWTYGIEAELADWDTRKSWLDLGRDPEPNICNSNGIAADPTLKSYHLGGEINTKPTSTPEAQITQLKKFYTLHPNALANWSCGLHVHIRVPGLKECLPALKHLTQYINNNTEVYDLVDVFPPVTRMEYPTEEEYKAARLRLRFMNKSHKTVLGSDRIANQVKSKNCTEFFEGEVVQVNGQPFWYGQPRAGINLRQLLQTDTIEFRHFVMSNNNTEVVNAIKWCKSYLLAAFENVPATEVFHTQYKRKKFPTLDTLYVHWQGVLWKMTSISKNKRVVIDRNIAAITRLSKVTDVHTPDQAWEFVKTVMRDVLDDR